MGEIKEKVLDRLAEWIAERLNRESRGYEPFTPSDPETLLRSLQPADVLLVEGNRKLSSAIKYLTQSTWSHAALFVGDALGEPVEHGDVTCLIEVELGEGCIASPLSKYACFNTRICRPVGLTAEDRRKVVNFMVGKLGTQYDMRNIIDLARYLLPTPPVPVRWRRRMIALGSGDPTRAICSTLIAEAFQQVRYPILPRIERLPQTDRAPSPYSRREILHIRHHSLFTPRDFDLSPYFRIVKPTLEFGFDYKRLEWGDTAPPAEGESETETDETPSPQNSEVQDAQHGTSEEAKKPPTLPPQTSKDETSPS